MMKLDQVKSDEEKSSQGNVRKLADSYLQMRKTALSLSMDQLDGLLPINGVLAVGVEIGFPEVYATVIASCFGDGSVYLSNGHIIIGGGRFEKVRKSAFDLIDRLHRKKSLMTSVSTPSLPSTNEVSFFAITTKGFLHYRASLDALLNEGDQFAEVFSTGQELLYLIRQYADSHHHSAVSN